MSNTVALDFGRAMFGRVGAVVFACMVAFSCFGALNGAHDPLLRRCALSIAHRASPRVLLHLCTADLRRRQRRLSPRVLRSAQQDAAYPPERHVSAGCAHDHVHRHRRGVQEVDQLRCYWYDRYFGCWDVGYLILTGFKASWAFYFLTVRCPQDR